jgi:prepilin-type N-terminal cleavage/methylation domain-containing protein/prepilin-type processing-associated H-X9-DG protein
MKVKNKTSYSCPIGTTTDRLPSAFSLIELLVVISIIALLLSILMPSLARARAAALRLKCAHNLSQIHMALHLYLNANEDTFPCSQDPLPGGYWLWMGRWRSFVEPYLGGKITEKNPSVVVCPQDTTYNDSYEAFSYAYSMTFYHSPEQIDQMNTVEDTYIFARPSIPQRLSNVSKPARKILAGEWFSNHFSAVGDQGWWSWRGRRNYLFVDGRVDYLDAEQIRPARDHLPDANLTINGIKGVDWPP